MNWIIEVFIATGIFLILAHLFNKYLIPSNVTDFK